ncbi:hypothetical protein ACQ4M4_21730 [Leptolyngbya sp. AN02str]
MGWLLPLEAFHKFSAYNRVMMASTAHRDRSRVKSTGHIDLNDNYLQ